MAEAAQNYPIHESYCKYAENRQSGGDLDLLWISTGVS